MATMSTLEDVMSTSAPTEEVIKNEEVTTPVEPTETPVSTRPIPKEGEEVIETEEGYRIVKKEDVSATEDARELHSSTPESSLDNLAKLSQDMDEKVEMAKQIKEEYDREVELDKALNETEDESKFKDEIIEVPEEEIEKIEKKEDPEKAKREAEEAKALSEIKILKFKKEDQKKKQYDRILEKRKKIRDEEANQCVLINSGYSAKYSGFLSPEMLAIRTNQENSDVYSATKYMYEKMYAHQVDTSVGKMTWEQWLKGTSLLELNSIFFSLFCSTYPEVNEYPGSCEDKKCNEQYRNKPFTFKYQNKKLMYMEDADRDEVSKDIVEILHSKNPLEDFKKSNVHYVVRKRLESGTIIDFRHPSLYNHLTDTLEKLNKLNLLNADSESEALFNMLPYIDNMYVEDSELGGYIELENLEDKLTELQFMNDDDLVTCGDVVEDIQNSYKIKFGFRGLVCPRCGKKLHDQPIPNMSEILFLVQLMRAAKKDI